MTTSVFIVRYFAFAALATFANLGTQRLVLSQGESIPQFITAIVAGTMTGLVVKYILDKRWIFFDYEKGLRAHSIKFSGYAAMGIITTLIFWGTETVFWVIWQTELMRELGAIIGLTIGYSVKYHLDRCYVFTTSSLEAQR